MHPQVEVELRPCMCRRTVTALLPRPCSGLSPRRLLHHIKATLGESTCGDLATLRGAGQKVCSYVQYTMPCPATCTS